MSFDSGALHGASALFLETTIHIQKDDLDARSADDDEGSLFGDGSGDDVFFSPCTETSEDSATDVALPITESPPKLVKSSDLADETGIANQLEVPAIPDQPSETLTSHKVGYTSGLHMVSAPDLSQASQNLNLEDLELEAMMEAELLKDQDVNVHISSANSSGGDYGPADAACYRTDAASEDELGQNLDALLEFDLLKDQAARSTTSYLTSSNSELWRLGVGLEEVPGFRWPHAATRRGIRLPRRIDFHEEHTGVLVPYLVIRRLRQDEHIERLELSREAGKSLIKEIRNSLRCVTHPSSGDATFEVTSAEGKEALLRLAFRLLKTEGFGVKYFGRSSVCRRAGKIYWPEDSTKLLLIFAGLVHKLVCLERAKQKSLAKRLEQLSGDTNARGTGSRLSPIDLCDDPCRSSSMPALPPYSSPALFAVESRSPHESEEVMDGFRDDHEGTLTRQGSEDSLRRPSVDNTSSLAVHVSRKCDAPDQEASSRMAFERLIHEVSLLKQRKRCRSIARSCMDLRYRILFKDSDDGEDLRPAVWYRHGDPPIASGVFRHLRFSFSGAGAHATVQIETPQGFRVISSQEEWDTAVGQVWEQKGAGATVEVRILV